MLADVVLPSRRFQVFTYHIPAQFRSHLHVGTPVVVPLGSTIISGIVVNLLEPARQTDVPQHGRQPLRDILALETNASDMALDQSLIRLLEKMAEYYLVSVSACLRLIVPPQAVKIRRRLFITSEGRLALSDPSLPATVQPILQKLAKSSKGLLRSSLIRGIKQSPDILAYAKKKKWVMEQMTAPSGMQTPDDGGTRESSHTLLIPSAPEAPNQKMLEQAGGQRPWDSAEDRHVWDRLHHIVQAGEYHEFPLFGPEALRDTVLMHTVEAVVHLGRRALILVPEVQHAEVLGDRLQAISGSRIEVYHGRLSPAKRAAGWKRIREGGAEVIVGTRSSLFLPIPRLGLIWIEQEENSSYKEEHLPYYHARDVARMRGECEHTVVVYSSACPSVETFGRFPNQIGRAFPPSSPQDVNIEMIDLRPLPYETILSPVLQAAIAHTLDVGEQVILLLNRKGFSAALLCRDCGVAPTCSNCGVALQLFQHPTRVLCSYCQNSGPAPETCPTCQGTVFRFLGTGTQRLEEEVRRLFPACTVGRFDRENITTSAGSEAMVNDFRLNKIQMLIATELLVHHANPPAAGLIGFPRADVGLHIPDFRSAERTFQILTKTLALARSRNHSARVVIQTRLPDHYVFQAVGSRHPQRFYDQELAFRELLQYPPAAHLIVIVLSGSHASRIQKVIPFLRQRLDKLGHPALGHDKTQEQFHTPMILGPMMSRTPGRLQKMRLMFLIKTTDLIGMQTGLRAIQQEYDSAFSREPVVMEINVDPVKIQ